MNNEIRSRVLHAIDTAHTELHDAYPEHITARDTPEWMTQRRVLLADLALHLAEDAKRSDAVEEAALADRLFSLLYVARDLTPTSDAVKQAVETLQASAA
jgi:hypothetical protein